MSFYSTNFLFDDFQVCCMPLPCYCMHICMHMHCWGGCVGRLKKMTWVAYKQIAEQKWHRVCIGVWIFVIHERCKRRCEQNISKKEGGKKKTKNRATQCSWIAVKMHTFMTHFFPKLHIFFFVFVVVKLACKKFKCYSLSSWQKSQWRKRRWCRKAVLFSH